MSQETTLIFLFNLLLFVLFVNLIGLSQGTILIYTTYVIKTVIKIKHKSKKSNSNNNKCLQVYLIYKCRYNYLNEKSKE